MKWDETKFVLSGEVRPAGKGEKYLNECGGVDTWILDDESVFPRAIVLEIVPFDGKSWLDYRGRAIAQRWSSRIPEPPCRFCCFFACGECVVSSNSRTFTCFTPNTSTIKEEE